jgi:hypothetical protein
MLQKIKEYSSKVLGKLNFALAIISVHFSHHPVLTVARTD